MSSGREVVLFGPLPPPVGGTTGTFADFVEITDSLGVAHRIIDTSPGRRRCPVPTELRSALRLLGLLPRRGPLVVFANRRLVLGLHPLLGRLAARGEVALVVFAGRLGTVLLELPPRRRARVARNLGRFTGIFVESEMVRSELERAGVRSEVVGQIRRSPDHPSSVRRFRAGGRVRLAYAGRICHGKGIEELCALADDPDLDVVVMGPVDGDAGELAAMLDASRATVLPPGGREDVLELYAASDFGILVSSWPTEGIPGSLLESLSVGTPVIVSAHRALPELTHDGTCGIVVGPDGAAGWDLDGLRARLRELDERDHARMRSAARAAIDAVDPVDQVAMVLRCVGALGEAR